jgi:protein-tyrosine phosphatase/membrane-associated phospholipid phosphatase
MNWRRRQALVAVALSLLFLVVYGFCNRITAYRSDVHSIYFEWERHIPFVAALIAPYMSIDLFFIGAPFLAATDRELRVFSYRIITAILLAACCFLIFPLRFAFLRPPVHGLLGIAFDGFRKMDLPFNQFPSLHAAFWLILMDLYLKHVKGPLRWLLVGWFVLIIFSTVLTYQHHILDVVGGIGLGIVCIYVYRDIPFRQPLMANIRVGLFYAGGFIVLILLGLFWRPWGYMLWWPAASLGLNAVGYVWLGPGIFRKNNGKIPATAWFMLWPVLLGQRISWNYYSRQCTPHDRLTDHLWIGRTLSNSQAANALRQGVTAVVDLTGELPEAISFRKSNYFSLPMMDLTAPTDGQIDKAIDFIEKHVGDGTVLLHCKVGFSRTAVIAGAYLLASGQAQTVDEAIKTMRRIRVGLIVRPEARAALCRYHDRIKSAHPGGVASPIP